MHQLPTDSPSASPAGQTRSQPRTPSSVISRPAHRPKQEKARRSLADRRALRQWSRFIGRGTVATVPASRLGRGSGDRLELDQSPAAAERVGRIPSPTWGHWPLAAPRDWECLVRGNAQPLRRGRLRSRG